MDTRDRAAAMKIVDESPVTLAQIATSGEVGPSTLYSWKAGERNPSPRSLERWADGLEVQGRRLLNLAADLRALLARSSSAPAPEPAPSEPPPRKRTRLDPPASP